RGPNDPSHADLPFGRIARNSVHHAWGQAIQGSGLGDLVSLIAVYLTTERRLSAANNTASINFSIEPATLPLHHLYESDDLEKKLSRLFRQAFDFDLVVNRAAGSQVMLHFGAVPAAPGGDRVARAYRDAVRELPTIQSQGDGIRAFVGVLLHVLVVDRDIILIDEPEAFLHPPQAGLLGRMLATETPDPRQLFVATHSSD